MISRSLNRDDFLWGLDHSRRRYRVRPTRHGDMSRLPARIPSDFLTIVRVRGGRAVVMRAKCGVSPGPWFDTDEYASFRLLAIDLGRAARERGGAA